MPLLTGLYAGLAGLLLLLLSVRVISRRVAARVSLGDGGDVELLRRVRAHANFCEFVPLALILIALVETGGSAPWVVHALGAPLIAGRAVHAWSIPADSLRGRQIGMMLTFAVLAMVSVICIVQAAGRIAG
jgi:hypothetical protein